MTLDLKWEEPEPWTTVSTRYRYWVHVVEELKRNPGHWALVGEDVTSSVMALLKKYGCEATTRGTRNGRAAKIYARWPETTNHNEQEQR